jgi:hypothetical protein
MKSEINEDTWYSLTIFIFNQVLVFFPDLPQEGLAKLIVLRVVIYNKSLFLSKMLSLSFGNRL